MLTLWYFGRNSYDYNWNFYLTEKQNTIMLNINSLTQFSLIIGILDIKKKLNCEQRTWIYISYFIILDILFKFPPSKIKFLIILSHSYVYVLFNPNWIQLILKIALFCPID